MKGISIVIATLHRTEYLLNTLKDLKEQIFEFTFEIIIVDQSNKPDDKVIKFVSDYSFIKYHHTFSFKGLPEARNYGWQNASFDLILFIDDDIRCNKSLLQEHFQILQQENIGVVAGGIVEVFKENQECKVGDFNYWTATPLRGFHKNGTFEVAHGGGGNFSTKKEVLQKVNGIDENLTKGAALYEETDFCLRVKNAGYKIMFHSKASVNHLAAETGGCRVVDIEKYIYALVRNRSLIIQRHLKFIYKFTAHAYLLRLVIAYAISYKKIKIFKSYFEAKNEGKKAGVIKVKCSNYNV